eukprot:tig00001292_g8047.t1
MRTSEPPHKEQDLREIGNLAVWSLSTAKPGNGVEQLRDDNLDTYWQSDGPQPHLVNVQFYKKMRVSEIAIFTDYKLDESYTPQKISIRAGSNFHDLHEIKLMELEEPSGWITIPLKPAESAKYVRAFLLQIAITQNHQNGRDTHIRQIKVYGPRGYASQLSPSQDFSSPEFNAYACVR